MQQLEVYCSVSNCHYWSQGNHCHANKILITSDSVGADQPDNFDAPEVTNSLQTPCNSCMETCCKSFVHKDSQGVTVDGIYKQ